MKTFLDNRQRYFIEKYLTELSFVTWDRFYRPTWKNIVVYGWISREEDDYKDFVTVTFDIENLQVIRYTTSSEKYSERICNTLWDDVDHSECMRVEDHLRIKNSIKLDEDDNE